VKFMAEELFDQLLDYLENDTEVPEAPTVKRRWQATAGLFKHLYGAVDREENQLEEIAKRQEELIEMLSSHIDKYDQSPPLILWMRQHLGRAFTGGIAILFLLISMWFGLAHVDSVAHISNLDTSITFGSMGIIIGGLGLLMRAT